MKIPGLLPTELSFGKGEKTSDKNAELRQACREFEALFIQSMLKGMHATVPDSGLLDKDAGRDIYREMMDIEIARQIAGRGNGLGIGRTLYERLSRQQTKNRIP
ncbi:flagellar protein FlgJ [Geothermobacter ehrlichii]|uniref:Flagellar protein FlgJ n=1 Tax=Geothermobacter ehrlichii TaxID=213224 RepID=A0A5D3WMF9_9BACT|nr:rod-binding protein [Geothermobacter ehrlichii]TYP00183.1 flagellar protein FlgJ [Geothermobacter ehrlichii]